MQYLESTGLVLTKERNMFNFLKRIFRFVKKEEKRQPIDNRSNEHVMDHDMIDYDGMGNQGRFPMHK